MTNSAESIGTRHSTARWWLGLLLILPIPLIWGTAAAYATRDFYNVDRWIGEVLAFSVPLLSLIGVALLPLKGWARVVVAVVLVPIACIAEFSWGAMFVCGQFGDCL